MKANATNATDLDVRALIAEAASWRLASLLLERPRPEWRNEIAALSREASDESLLSCVDDVANATEENYHALFGPGGTVSPREVSYCGFEDPGHLMADLQAFYDAFSYLPMREDPIDHICVEAGFVSYLFLKEAYARREGNAEGAAITNSARNRFLRQHISRSAEGIRDRMGRAPHYLASASSWVEQRAQSWSMHMDSASEL